MAIGKFTSVVEAAQPKLLDVKLTEAHQESERYAEIWDDIENRKEMLNVQAEKVMVAMGNQKLRAIAVRDAAGLTHKFEIKLGDLKLKHSRMKQSW